MTHPVGQMLSRPQTPVDASYKWLLPTKAKFLGWRNCRTEGGLRRSAYVPVASFFFKSIPVLFPRCRYFVIYHLYVGSRLAISLLALGSYFQSCCYYFSHPLATRGALCLYTGALSPRRILRGKYITRLLEYVLRFHRTQWACAVVQQPLRGCCPASSSCVSIMGATV